jgi:signal transduction histidine kinase/CheY-like chemotaxis protein
MKLRLYLAILLLAGVIPLSVLTIVVSISLVHQQRDAVARGLSETAAAVGALVATEVETSIKSLETLATSQRLDNDDLAAFYEQARRVRAHHQWSTIGLIDSTGEHRLNLARPLGSSLPDLRDREYFKHVVATRTPYVSDLITGRATPTVDIGVAVPVLRDGRLKYVLVAGVDPARFGALLAEQRSATQALAAIVGRDGIIVARSRDHSAFVGHSLPSEDLSPIRSSPHGNARITSLEGIGMDIAYRQIPLTGWTVYVGVATEAVNGPARHIAWLAAIVGGAIVLGAVALAGVFAQRIARDMRFLSSAASTIGQGMPSPPAGHLNITELEDMRRFMASADEVLRERERERTALLMSEQTARGQAEGHNRAKDQFLAMLGHELRNPLGAIATAAGVLRAIGQPDERAMRSCGVIARQVQHLSRLVDDLLDVTRVTTGKVRLDKRLLNVGELVENLVSVWRASGRLDHHDVSVEVQSAWVVADETRIEQVVGNLIGNALKYTSTAGRVSICVRQAAGTALIEVEDAGIGIPPHLLPTVFDLFVQGDRTLDRAQGGLGLGLTLVKTLVGLHGGTVEAKSDGPSLGALFTVRLPLVAVPAPESGPAEVRSPVSIPRRVLLVEDSDDSRTTLRDVLTVAGHEVKDAADGAGALRIVTADALDVALIDIGLPEMNGYDLARHIRLTPQGKTMYLIAITGYGQFEDRLRAMDAGFDAHLTKPVLPERLVEVIAGTPSRADT